MQILKDLIWQMENLGKGHPRFANWSLLCSDLFFRKRISPKVGITDVASVEGGSPPAERTITNNSTAWEGKAGPESTHRHREQRSREHTSQVEFYNIKRAASEGKRYHTLYYKYLPDKM